MYTPTFGWKMMNSGTASSQPDIEFRKQTQDEYLDTCDEKNNPKHEILLLARNNSFGLHDSHFNWTNRGFRYLEF